MSPIQFLRGLLALILTPILTFFVSLFALIDLLWGRCDERKAQQFPRWWGRTICQLAGVSVRIEGLERLDPQKTCIFAANHASQFDIFAFQGHFPHDFRWMAKKELFRPPVFGQAMRKTGYIPVDRSNSREAMKSMDQAAERIAAGTSVLIFPEGTRSADGHLQEFKGGAALLAIKAGVALVPIGINGSHEVLPKGSLFARSGQIVLRIGEPIPTTGLKARDKKELTDQLRTAIIALLDVAHQPLEPRATENANP